MADSVAPFTFANELGIIRKEYVASTIDALRLDTHAGQPNGCKLITKVLRAPNAITGPKQRLLTQSLLDVETGNPLEIPVGSTIETVKVCKSSSANLDDNFSFLLGFLSNDVAGKDAKKALAGRIAPANNQVSGRLLNKHHCIGFSQRLTADFLKAQQDLYEADAIAQGEEPEADVNYGVVAGNTYVGESKSLFPALTTTDGTLADVNDLVFCVQYHNAAVPVSH